MGSEYYAQKLRDPRWQRRRLEVMQRDNFTCQECGDDTHTLHVHHTKYVGGNPWDTPSEFLVTICEACHKAEHGLDPQLETDPEKHWCWWTKGPADQLIVDTIAFILHAGRHPGGINLRDASKHIAGVRADTPFCSWLRDTVIDVIHTLPPVESSLLFWSELKIRCRAYPDYVDALGDIRDYVVDDDRETYQ